MNAAQQRRLTPLLAAVALVLGIGLLALATGMGRGVRWAAPRVAPPLPPAGNPADLPRPLPLQQFAAVWQRPLFSPNRQPIARAADGGSNLGDLQLTGIILTPSLRMALLHDKNGNRELRLQQGQSLPDGSITLVEVRPRSVLLDSTAGRSELKLPAGAPIDPLKAAATAPQPPPPPGAAQMQIQPRMIQPRGINRGRTLPTQPPQGADNPPSSPVLQRLRQTIEQRRAAAAHQGER